MDVVFLAAVPEFFQVRFIPHSIRFDSRLVPVMLRKRRQKILPVLRIFGWRICAFTSVGPAGGPFDRYKNFQSPYGGAFYLLIGRLPVKYSFLRLASIPGNRHPYPPHPEFLHSFADRFCVHVCANTIALLSTCISGNQKSDEEESRFR